MSKFDQYLKEDKKDTYIVYDKKTFRVLQSFKFFGKDITKFLADTPNSAWINITLPTHKEILSKLKF